MWVDPERVVVPEFEGRQVLVVFISVVIAGLSAAAVIEATED